MTDVDAVGLVLENRYRVEAAVGGAHAGGMVYRGRDKTNGATVVIRCPALPATLTGAELDAALDAFKRDAATLSRIAEATADVEKLLSHGVAELPGGERLAYCVFEWLAGRSLERHLAERKRSVSSLGEAMVILEPAARALATAHAMGAAHGDVRPANLWLAESGGRTRLKVAAFSLASRVGVEETPFAPMYGAPEHFKRSYGPLGPATDVYGLALCLVEMITGKPALEGADAAELYLVTSDLARRPSLRAHGVHASENVEQVVLRALAVDPKRRWPTAREFWDALVAAVPELTPAPPSVAPAPLLPMSIPPGATSPIYGSMLSAPPPAEDARLGGALPIPRRRDVPREAHGSAKAWLIVAAVALLAIVVVAVKVGRPAARRATPPDHEGAAAQQPKAAAPTGEPARSAADPAIHFRPFHPDMVRVAAATFTMGSDKYERAERPAHAVTLTHAFYIDRTEVTAEAYWACVDAGACPPNKMHSGELVESEYGCNSASSNPRHPANCVDRLQAEKYCTFVSKRLPTEAEWELAARGTDGREFPWGNDAPLTCAKAVLANVTGACADGRKGTWEVGTTHAGKGPYGAMDMAGNVWEWVADGFADYPTGDVTDPKAPLAPGARAILRGGSYDYATTFGRTSFRYPFPPTSGYAAIGFRCATDATD